ncbi:MAG: hypothetical protein AAGI08_02715 [Bacteroidota bacterium]
MPLFHPYLAIALVVAALVALIVGLRVARGRGWLAPEESRKALHVGMGLVTVTFPFVFEGVWPVAVLFALAISAMLALRVVPALRGHAGVLHDIQRDSYGDLYFPIAVLVLYLLAAETPILYVIPLLLLGLADAVAALVGVRYGTASYEAGEGIKSAEGSLAFFTTAFLSTHVPLLLFTDTGRLETLLIAGIVGLLAMLLEAVAWKGLDNLFVPLGGYALLRTHLEMETWQLAVRLAVALILVAGVLLYRRRTTLNDGALLAAALLGYVSWGLGGWEWMLAPVVLFLTYTRLWPKTPENSGRNHDVRVVIGVMLVGVGWLLIAVMLRQPALLYAYTVAYAAYLSLIGATQYGYAHPERSVWQVQAASVLRAAPLVMVTYPVVAGLTVQNLLLAAFGLVPAWAAVWFWLRVRSAGRVPIDDETRWILQGVIVAGASVLALVALGR